MGWGKQTRGSDGSQQTIAGRGRGADIVTRRAATADRRHVIDKYKDGSGSDSSSEMDNRLILNGGRPWTLDN